LVSATIGSSDLPNTVAYLNSTQTWTAQQTYSRTVVISTTIGLGSVGATGSSGQFLQSNGPGATPTWVSPASANALLSSTNTWTAGQTFQSSVTISSNFYVLNGGLVGFGTPTPTAPLQVENSSLGRTLYIINGTNAGTAIDAWASNTNGTGVFGEA